MKLQLISDVHTELHADEGFSFVKSLDASGVDVLVIAGDFVSWDPYSSAQLLFAIVCAKYSHVIYVPGNHDHWGADVRTLPAVFRKVERDNKNLAILDNRETAVLGRRFLGGTMWFPETASELTARWSDFRRIKDLSPWVFEQNAVCRSLIATTAPGDVVVTHHLPSLKSVSPKYQGDASNCFFVTEMDKEIVSLEPSVWLHGHTHTACDYILGETRVVCNPFGYRGERTGYQDKLIIEV